MKILMFSADPRAFDTRSAFYGRLIEYSRLFEELHVIVFGARAPKATIGNNTFLWPVAPKIKFLEIIHAYRIGAHLLGKEPRAFVITTQEELSGLVGFFLKIRYGTPWQAQVHTDIMSDFYKNFSLKNRVRSFVNSIILPSASCLRVVSERIKKSLRLKQPVFLLPIYTSLEKYRGIRGRSYERKENLVFLMVSRLNPEKNIPLALEAFGELLKKYPHAVLHILGDGPMKKKLEIYTEQLKIRPSVTFLGWQDDVQKFLIEADVFLSTSWYEGFGLSVVEAAAAGLPIIMTDVGVAGELVKNDMSGLIVPPGDKNGLLRAMEKIAGDSLLRERLGQEARKATEALLSKGEYLEKFKESFLQCPKN